MTIVSDIEDKIDDLAIDIATQINTVRTNIGSLASLSTIAKGSLVLAINEVFQIANAAGESGGAASLNELSDVQTGVSAVGHILRHDGTQYTNVLGTNFFEPAGAAAAAATQAITDLIGAAPADLNEWAELVASIQASDAEIDGLMTSIATKLTRTASLDSFAAQPAAADTMPYVTALNTWGMMASTVAGRTLMGAVNAAAQRDALDVYSKAEIGTPSADFVATFQSHLNPA